MNKEHGIQNPFRILMAVIVAPFAGTLAGAVMMSIPILFVIAGCYVAYPIALILGVPIHLLLARRKIRSLAAYMLIGTAFGAIIAAIVLALGMLNLHGASFPLVSAIIGAGLFWRIAVPRPPSAQGPSPV
jgi:hypothetical protein